MNRFTNLTEEQIDALVQEEVRKQLSSKEDAEARRQAETALQEAKEVFETMKATIEAKDAKIREYEAVLANTDLDPTAAEVAANERVVELETSLNEWKHRAEIAEAALKTLELEETAAERMQSLDDAGLALNGEFAEAQYVKVRGMSDDEFASYKNELVAFKSQYSTATLEEVVEEETEAAELSSDDIKLIAQSLGCDPADAKCTALVQEVAQRMSEISKKKKLPPWMQKPAKEECTETTTEIPAAEAGKEVASVQPMSLGEALAKAIDQNIQAPASLKQEIAQEWEKLRAARAEAKK